MAASLLQLSNELLHCILVEIDPNDLLNLMLTCKDLNSYIKGNNVLHRDIYYRNWDFPADDVEWQSEVRNVVKLGKIFDSSDPEVKEAHLKFVAEKIQYLLKTAHSDIEESFNVAFLTDHFTNELNTDAFLTFSEVFRRADTHPHRTDVTVQQQQLSAKLHCLYGVPITEYPNRIDEDLAPSPRTRQQTKAHQIHTYARSKVYDLREYTEKSLWGPFHNDGSHSIDWEKVEAILIDLQYNIEKYHERTSGRFPLLWTTPFEGVAPDSFASVGPEEEPASEDLDNEAVKIREMHLELDQLDPFGVTGTWLRVVCFLDYNELYSFNFLHPRNRTDARPPIDCEEAIRLIRIKWRVTKIEPPGTEENGDDETQPDWSNFQGDRLPIVHFAGTSRSLHAAWDPDANSKIRGTVRQTPEGEIRWTTFSIFHGEERWRSESVQVGGLRSGRGVVGNWFDKDFSVHGPAGPTAFWKESDRFSEDKAQHQHWPYF